MPEIEQGGCHGRVYPVLGEKLLKDTLFDAPPYTSSVPDTAKYFGLAVKLETVDIRV